MSLSPQKGLTVIVFSSRVGRLSLKPPSMYRMPWKRGGRRPLNRGMKELASSACWKKIISSLSRTIALSIHEEKGFDDSQSNLLNTHQLFNLISQPISLLFLPKPRLIYKLNYITSAYSRQCFVKTFFSMDLKRGTVRVFSAVYIINKF